MLWLYHSLLSPLIELTGERPTSKARNSTESVPYTRHNRLNNSFGIYFLRYFDNYALSWTENAPLPPPCNWPPSNRLLTMPCPRTSSGSECLPQSVVWDGARPAGLLEWPGRSCRQAEPLQANSINPSIQLISDVLSLHMGSVFARKY